MRNGLTLFLGAFAILALSWAGLLLTAHRQLGGLNQVRDPADDVLYPLPLSGIADQGRLVYQDLGCVTCHTQQVRPDPAGADIARKWGERGSYARDYVRETTVFIGQNRIGPDLRNVGARIPDAEYFYKLLYAPESKFGGAPIAHGMPPHAFLFDVHPLTGRQPSAHAVAGVGPAGSEVVPTRRAEALVAYLMSLKDTYDYPIERERNAPAPAESHGATAPAEKPKEGGH